jgi:hypothetical protein
MNRNRPPISSLPVGSFHVHVGPVIALAIHIHVGVAVSIARDVRVSSVNPQLLPHCVASHMLMVDS